MSNPFQIDSLPLINQGKVRDIYAVGDDKLLMVSTDRVSAFDVVLPDLIPDKGIVLTDISKFWFAKSSHIVPNHLLTDFDLSSVLTAGEVERVGRHAMVVQRLKPLPVEAIVRGYLIGSGWKDYQKTGAVCGLELPQGLQQAQQLPHTLYTPSTKAAVGDHDENISFEQTVDILGEGRAKQIRDISVQLYDWAAAYALERGIIMADTKFEFGLDEDDNLVLMDEALTPDSSRFWDVQHYQVGTSPESFDKQILRDYLETLDWDKTPPGPILPSEIVQRIQGRYFDIQRILLG